jgi:LL-diaminopimelate aminotransferase
MTYSQGARFAGAEPYPLALLQDNDYLPDFSAIPREVAQRAKLMWLNYPHNPTAAVAPLATFASAVSFCQDHGILLCHDAAYTQITYDGYRAPSVLEVPGAVDVVVEFNSLSKSHNMAGWRVGVAVGHEDSLAALLKLKTHADSGQFLPVMEAAVAALTSDQSWLEERNAIYQRRREVVLAALRKTGFEVSTPKASLYVWLKLPDPWDSENFVLRLLDETYLSLSPGSIFGPQGDGYVRISLTQPVETLQEAMERLCNWV